MSRSFCTNSGSRDSLNCRTRCGCNPWVRQIRCTELTLIPTALGIIGRRPIRRFAWRIAERQRDGAIAYARRQRRDA
jgi:hypothetical protein